MNRVAELLARGVGEPVGRAAQHAVELLTHRQIAEARAVRLTSALRRLAGVLDDGANVRGDGMVLIPLPWARAGHQQWGLSRDEAATLRAWLVGGHRNKRTGRQDAAPIVYSADSRRWFVLGDLAAAVAWLANHSVVADDVLKYWPRR
jgi:hypothetical protein